MQIAVPMKVGAFGLEETIIAIARGDFALKDGRFVFDPASVTIGSCVLDRLPGVRSYVFQKIVGSYPIPEDIAAAWEKLVAARIEGSELKLTMP